jgi:hypothetical protein
VVKEKILQILSAAGWNAVMLIRKPPSYFLDLIVVWVLREVVDDEVSDEPVTEVVGMTAGNGVLPAESVSNFFLHYSGDQVTPELAESWKQASPDFWQRQKAEKIFTRVTHESQ